MGQVVEAGCVLFQAERVYPLGVELVYSSVKQRGLLRVRLPGGLLMAGDLPFPLDKLVPGHLQFLRFLGGFWGLVE